jgi:hypothetical protein
MHDPAVTIDPDGMATVNKFGKPRHPGIARGYEGNQALELSGWCRQRLARDEGMQQCNGPGHERGAVKLHY